jgi:hypothetical protein
VTTIAILQDLIVKRMPKDSSTRILQSWMTFFTLVFLYLGITEVYDETGLMLFRPKKYAELLQLRNGAAPDSAREERSAQRRLRNHSRNGNRGE